MLKCEQPVIFGDGEQTRDFIYVAGVVAANILTFKSSACGVFNIACAKSTSLNTLGSL
jgi:UDP-glucose 4-epimerase